MQVERITAKDHGYHCDGCNKRADLVVEFRSVDGVVAFCYACALGAAAILDEHARYFKRGE